MRLTIDTPVAERPSVAALLQPDPALFEYACVAEVFGLDRDETGGPLYRFDAVALDDQPVTGLGGVELRPAHRLDRLARADYIVIPACRNLDAPPPTALLDALRAAHARGARLVSVCSGSFALAWAGLLDGRPAATHWRYADRFRELFPRVDLDPDVLYVDDDPLFTSAGSAAGIDLCLHIVRRDYGVDVANRVARRLVVPPHRDGGQAQYVNRPLPPADVGSRLSEWMDLWRAKLDAPHSAASMAADMGLSERSLLRRFQEATGHGPHEWLQRERIHHAQALLEATTLPLDRIAERAGFGSTETFRHHFRRLTRTTPSAFRRQFNVGRVVS